MDAEGLFYLEINCQKVQLKALRVREQKKMAAKENKVGKRVWESIGRNLHLAEIREVKDVRYGHRS